jgi:hypothetical protein
MAISELEFTTPISEMLRRRNYINYGGRETSR